MPRKKSASGRARGFSSVNQIILQAEKINRQLSNLEQESRFGTYKSKELLEFVSRRPSLKLVKSKKTRRRLVVDKRLGLNETKAEGRKRYETYHPHRIVVDKSKLTIGEQALIDKKLKSIIKSQAFYDIGINKIERKIVRKIRKTLSEEAGRRISRRELERFFDIINYSNNAKKNSILKQIDPSEFQKLVNSAIEERKDLSDWINMIENHSEINNRYIRREAKYLYERYVKPSR